MISTARREALERELQDLERLEAEAERRGFFRTPTFAEFVRYQNPSRGGALPRPGLLDYEHIQALVALIDDVLDGFEARWNGRATHAPTRLLICEPPRYFKSTLFSKLLPAYFLRRFPQLMVGLACHSEKLALEYSENAREYFQSDGGHLKPGTEAKSRWATADGGEMWATGVSAQFMGRGYHLGIVDDPMDPEKVVSATYQKRYEDWWPNKWLSRQEPGAILVHVMQRLGPSDPVDFLLRREVGEKTPKAPEGWYCVMLDEIKSEEPFGRWDGPKGLPSTCDLHEDDRDVGDVLAPTRFDAEEVEKQQGSAGPYTTSSQRQQRPLRPRGDFWRKKWFRTYDTLPDRAYNRGKDWDTAYTKKEANSATAYVESYRGPGDPESFPIYIEDIDWDWLEFPELVEWMESRSGPHYVERKATGKSVVQALKAQGVAAEEVAVKGDKFARASAVQPVVSTKRVWVNQRIYDQFMTGDIQGLLRITAEALQSDGDGLDLNDAFVQAIFRHVEDLQTKKKKGTIDFR